MRRARTLGVPLLLVAALLSGCASPAPEPIAIPRPSVGSTWTYEGPAGQVNVTVAETAPRYDGVFRVHPTVVLNITVDDPTGDAACNHPPNTPVCYLGEAVDRADGRIVQHWNKCGLRTSTPTWCDDPRALVVFDGGGLPGGFGAGPLWGSTVADGERTVRLSPLALDRDRLNYSVEPITSEWGSCRKLSSVDEVDRRGLQTSTLSVLTGPFTVCDNRPLPVAFTTVTGDRYELVSRDPGGDVISGAETSRWTEQGHPFPREPWRAPIAVSDLPDTPFPVEEAHNAALNNSDAYRRLFEGHPDALVVGTSMYKPFDSDMKVGGGAGERIVYRRTLAAVAPDGTGVNITLDKEIQTGPAGQNVSQVTVENVRNTSWPNPPTSSSLPDRLATVGPMATIAEPITGQPLSIRHDDGGLAPTSQPVARYLPGLTTNFGGEGVLRDGMTVTPWIYDPPPYIEGVITPYAFVAEGATGHVSYIEANRTRLPLDEPPTLPYTL